MFVCFGLSPAMRAVDSQPDGGYWTWRATGSLNTARYSHTATLLQNGMVLVAGGYDSNMLPRAPNCTTRRAVPGLPQAASTPHAVLTRRRCYKTAWSLLQGELTAISCFRERRTVRPGERDLDCHRQPQHRTRYSHGDVATKRHGPCCRGIDGNFNAFRERRTVRPGERDLDCHRQPQHRTLFSHGDVATKRHGPCCRGIGDGSFRERRTVRPGERDLDCHRQPQHRTRFSHGDVATKRHGPCCRGNGQHIQLPRAPNCTTRRAGPGLPQAASTPHAVITRRRCYKTAWSLLQGD